MEEIILEDNLNQASTEFNIRQLNLANELIDEENNEPFDEFLDHFEQLYSHEPESLSDLKAQYSQLNSNINDCNKLRDELLNLNNDFYTQTNTLNDEWISKVKDLENQQKNECNYVQVLLP